MPLSAFFYAIVAAIIVSLISLVGVLTLSLKEKKLEKILLMLISFSAGAMLGGAFFHLLPEAMDFSANIEKIFIFTLIGMLVFFVLEKVLRWHHCHDTNCETHQHLGHLNLVGDAVHNLIDGIVIAAAFAVSVPLGMTVTLSITLHEIPQEISDFGVLIYAGFSRSKALLYNLYSALFALLGVLMGYFLILYIDHINLFLLPFTAGGFIYIAATDLVPEIHKENRLGRSILSFIFFVGAIVLMAVSKE
ncbi:MAG TPA: ZIP family metal transporter [bacterium]|nr:ZIP family metal transporter [bacterium]